MNKENINLNKKISHIEKGKCHMYQLVINFKNKDMTDINEKNTHLNKEKPYMNKKKCHSNNF